MQVHCSGGAQVLLQGQRGWLKDYVGLRSPASCPCHTPVVSGETRSPVSHMGDPLTHHSAQQFFNQEDFQGAGTLQPSLGHVYSPQFPKRGPGGHHPHLDFAHGDNTFSSGPFCFWKTRGFCLQSSFPQLPAGSVRWGLAENFSFKYVECAPPTNPTTKLGVFAALVPVGRDRTSSLTGPGPWLCLCPAGPAFSSQRLARVWYPPQSLSILWCSS